jgi:hypothetical protein
MSALGFLKDARQEVGRSLQVFLRDVGNGLLEISHNSLALVGLVVVAVVVFVGTREDVRQAIEHQAFGWLQERQEERDLREGNLLAVIAQRDAVSRATAADVRELSKQQAAIAIWLSRRYRVAPEPISRLVQEAWEVGQRAGLEPTLILAIMAIESGFNPFAQSTVGAQGLMQVMTKVHDDKYALFGGVHAAFDPVTNLRVGVQVLKECISRAGSLEAGLRFYVGAANFADDGGYAAKVLAEQQHLRLVASGKSVSITAPLPLTTAPTPLQVNDQPPAETNAPATTPALADPPAAPQKVAAAP